MLDGFMGNIAQTNRDFMGSSAKWVDPFADKFYDPMEEPTEDDPYPRLGEIGKYWQDQTFGATTGALKGEGFRGNNFAGKRAGLQDAFNASQPDFESVLNRTTLRGDTKTRDFHRSNRQQSLVGAKDDLRKAEQTTLYNDRELAKSLGTDQVAGAKRMGTDITSIYNQQNAADFANEQAYGTFNSNLAGGLGAAGGWMSASQRYGKGF